MGLYLGSRNSAPEIFSEVILNGDQVEGKVYIIEDGQLRLIHYQTWILRLDDVGFFTLPDNTNSRGFTSFEFAPGRQGENVIDGEMFALGQVPLFSNETLYTDPNYQRIGASIQTFFHVLQVLKTLFPVFYITSSHEVTFYDGLLTWQNWLKNVIIVDRKNLSTNLNLDSDEFAFEAFLVNLPDYIEDYDAKMNRVKHLPKKKIIIDYDSSATGQWHEVD